MTLDPQMEQLLVDYLDGTADPDVRQRVEEACARDLQLQRTLHDLAQVAGLLHQLPRAAAPQQVKEMIGRNVEQSGRFRLFRVGPLMALAASVLVVVGVAIVILSSRPEGGERVAVALSHPSSPAPAVSAPEPLFRQEKAALAYDALESNAAQVVWVLKTSDPATAQRQINDLFISNQIGAVQQSENIQAMAAPSAAGGSFTTAGQTPDKSASQIAGNNQQIILQAQNVTPRQLAALHGELGKLPGKLESQSLSLADESRARGRDSVASANGVELTIVVEADSSAYVLPQPAQPATLPEAVKEKSGAFNRD